MVCVCTGQAQGIGELGICLERHFRRDGNIQVPIRNEVWGAKYLMI